MTMSDTDSAREHLQRLLSEGPYEREPFEQYAKRLRAALEVYIKTGQPG